MHAQPIAAASPAAPHRIRTVPSFIRLERHALQAPRTGTRDSGSALSSRAAGTDGRGADASTTTTPP